MQESHFSQVVFVVKAIILSIIKDHNHSSNDICVEAVRLHPWILQLGGSLLLQPGGWSDPQLTNSEGRLKRGGRPQCCAARRPCTARYPGTMPGPWCAPTVRPCHLSLCHHQGPMYNTKPSSSIPPRQSQGLSAWVESLGNARVRSSSVPCHITLPMLPHAHGLLQNPSVSVFAPLYSPFCLDNRCSSSCCCPGIYADSSCPSAPH